MTHWLRKIWSRLWAVLWKERLDHEFDEELNTHLELLSDEGRHHGLSPGEARRQALQRLGRPESIRELHREQRGLPALELLAKDLRYAVRMLWKSRAFTCVAVISLAFGIGANTALFSIGDNLLLRSLPVREPDRLVQVQQSAAGLGIRKVVNVFPQSVFDYVRTHNQVFVAIIGFKDLDRPEVAIEGAVETTRGVEQVSENFFRDLGLTPLIGRVEEPSEDGVAILSYALWQTRFGGNHGVLGRTVSVDGRAYTIVGVAPAQFRGLSIESPTDLWISARTDAGQQMVARLKPGFSSSQAQAAMRLLFSQLAQAQPEAVLSGYQPQIDLLPAGKGLSQLRTQYERPLMALIVLVTLLLLTTCTNVGNLLVLRNTARRREIAVRAAIGASRSRIVLQLVVESSMLAALGGILALIFARWGVSTIISMLPLTAIPESLTFQADARMLAFTGAVSVVSAILFGLAPAWRATQVDLAGGLRASQGSTQARGTRHLGRLLVACQVGISVVLLVGAGLFVRTMRNLVRVDVGFNPENLLQVSIDTRGSGYRQGQVGAVYRLLLDRVSAIPGVRSAAGIRNPVMQNSLSRTRFSSLGPDRQIGPNEAWDSFEVGPSFFETMGIPVLRGRTFSPADFERGRALVLVSEAFAKYYFPNEDPTAGRVGQVIIGVVGDAKLSSVRRENGPLMYQLAPREPDRLDALVLRIAGEPEAIAHAVRDEVRRVNPRLLIGIRTMRQEIDQSLGKERMVATISALFSLLGLLLALIGIYGVASSTVAQRTNEIGIRMALGAGSWQVIRDALRDTSVMFAAGLVAGIAAAIAALRVSASFISDLLFGLTASDAVNISCAGLLMVIVAFAACIVPARRATSVDPVIALRYE